MVNSSSPSVTAVDLAERLRERREKEPVGNVLLEAAAKGRVTEESLRRLIGTEAHCHTAELVAYGTALARFPHRPAADLFIQLARLVYDAQPKLQACARALGMEGDVLADRWPTEHAAYAFNGTISWLASQGAQAAFALASYTDMQVYFSGCVEAMRRVRESPLDVPRELLDYYDDEAPDALTRLALDVVQDGLDRGDDPEDAVFCARLMEESIGHFWRAAAGTPEGSDV
ncbi:hypothetical protein AB0I22_25655 [Streptomyces sp. NPDC050610]|uniref:hypothetical protein n=1 Tax=Streptomyces sp. NPDC050610 TaxID=3157097 RepID=UPI00341D62C5